MNDLTLNKYEAVIQKGLDQFLKVGQALLHIKNKRLYRHKYQNFDQYLKDRWGISGSYGYQLIASSQIASELENPPTVQSHAHKLKILPPEIRQEAWQEVVDTMPEPTAYLVETVAQKHYVINQKSPLSALVTIQEIEPRKAYQITKRLDQLPSYYREYLGKHRKYPDSNTLDEIRSLEYRYPEEAKDILRSGFLNDIPLDELTPRDIQSYVRKIEWQSQQTRREEVATKQNNDLKSPSRVVLDGDDIHNLQLDSGVAFIFPENLPLDEVARILNRQGLRVFMAVVYKENPEVNFNGYRTKLSSINGVKPKEVTEFIESFVP